MITIIGGAMLVALVGGIALGLTWPTKPHHVELPADHPLQALPGTLIYRGTIVPAELQGEFL